MTYMNYHETSKFYRRVSFTKYTEQKKKLYLIIISSRFAFVKIKSSRNGEITLSFTNIYSTTKETHQSFLGGIVENRC